MFKQIVVPLDGSPVAETALEPACLLARRFEAPLLLVSTITLAVTAEMGAYLTRQVERLSAEGFSARAALPPGPPAEGISGELAFTPPALIVMTTHQRTGLEALLHPSITWSIFTQTTAPVLAIPGAEEQQAPPRLPVPRFLTDQTAPLLVPLDGSLLAEQALALAQQWARAYGHPLVLVRAVEPVLVGSVWETAALQWASVEAEGYLKRKQVELTNAGLKVDISSELGLAPEVILERVQRAQAGLIVIGSHGWGWMGRLVLGSVAKSVLQQADVPVLLVRVRKTSDGT